MYEKAKERGWWEKRPFSLLFFVFLSFLIIHISSYLKPCMYMPLYYIIIILIPLPFILTNPHHHISTHSFPPLFVRTYIYNIHTYIHTPQFLNITPLKNILSFHSLTNHPISSPVSSTNFKWFLRRNFHVQILSSHRKPFRYVCMCVCISALRPFLLMF